MNYDHPSSLDPTQGLTVLSMRVLFSELEAVGLAVSYSCYRIQRILEATHRQNLKLVRNWLSTGERHVSGKQVSTLCFHLGQRLCG